MNDSIKTYKVGEFLVQENGIVRSKAGRIIGKLSDFPEHITEILPDLDKMPEWAREAFEAGHFFDVAFKRVKWLEQTITALEAAESFINRVAAMVASQNGTQTLWSEGAQLEYVQGEFRRLHEIISEETFFNGTDQRYQLLKQEKKS